jgi:predicted peptidase
MIPIRRFLPLVCLANFLPALAAGPTAEVFERPATGTLRLPYLLSLPDGYDADPEKRWPLVVFLHGAGERGDELANVAKHGPPKHAAAGEKFPFILVSPQCPADEWWTEQPVLELIDSLEEKYRVDPSRIHLTGLSMGGYGTWHFATLAPGRFASVAPICGGGIPYKMRLIPHLPVWAFHGAKDGVVALDESARLVEALKKAGNTKVEFTVYPEAGHDSWTETYANPRFYERLLSHSLPQPANP